MLIIPLNVCEKDSSGNSLLMEERIFGHLQVVNWRVFGCRLACAFLSTSSKILESTASTRYPTLMQQRHRHQGSTRNQKKIVATTSYWLNQKVALIDFRCLHVQSHQPAGLLGLEWVDLKRFCFLVPLPHPSTVDNNRIPIVRNEKFRHLYTDPFPTHFILPHPMSPSKATPHFPTN